MFEGVRSGNRLKPGVKRAFLIGGGAVAATALVGIGYALPHHQPIRYVPKIIEKKVTETVENCPDGPIKTQQVKNLTFYTDTLSGCMWMGDAKGDIYTMNNPKGTCTKFGGN